MMRTRATNYFGSRRVRPEVTSVARPDAQGVAKLLADLGLAAQQQSRRILAVSRTQVGDDFMHATQSVYERSPAWRYRLHMSFTTLAKALGYPSFVPFEASNITLQDVRVAPAGDCAIVFSAPSQVVADCANVGGPKLGKSEAQFSLPVPETISPTELNQILMVLAVKQSTQILFERRTLSLSYRELLEIIGYDEKFIAAAAADNDLHHTEVYFVGFSHDQRNRWYIQFTSATTAADKFKIFEIEFPAALARCLLVPESHP